MVIDSNKIKGLMREKNITQSDIAKHLGIAQTTVCQKINNIRPMYLDEAKAICDLLNIESDKFGAYFFADKIA